MAGSGWMGAEVERETTVACSRTQRRMISGSQGRGLRKMIRSLDTPSTFAKRSNLEDMQLNSMSTFDRSSYMLE